MKIEETVKINGMNYSRFGVLTNFEVRDRHLYIYNDEGKFRRKSKVYASWTTTRNKLDDLIGQPVVTCASADSEFSSLLWFSDIYPDKGGIYKGVQYPLFGVPQTADEETAHMLIHSRLMGIFAVESEQRLARYELMKKERSFSEAIETAESLIDEQKDDLDKVVSDVKAAVPGWLDNDASSMKFGIWGKARAGKMSHADKAFAMRYRIDVTKTKRLEVAVKSHLKKNFIVGDVIIGNKVIECALALSKRREDNSWIIKTAIPLRDTVKHYDIENKILGNNKDRDLPLDFWLGIYDQVMAELNAENGG